MYESKIKQIAGYYDFESQLMQIAAESSELAHAALKLRRESKEYADLFDCDSYDNFLEKMADTLIMVERLCWLLECEQEIKDIVAEKLDRQLERIGEVAQR